MDFHLPETPNFSDPDTSASWLGGCLRFDRMSHLFTSFFFFFRESFSWRLANTPGANQCRCPQKLFPPSCSFSIAFAESRGMLFVSLGAHSTSTRVPLWPGSR